MKQDLVLDPEFSRFVPPLTPKELELLRESILREGCRDAIDVFFFEVNFHTALFQLAYRREGVHRVSRKTGN